MHDPGMRLALRQVLARADEVPEVVVLDDRVVDVLAGVELAGEDGRLVGDPEILGEDGVGAERSGRRVAQPNRPEPGGCLGGDPE